MGSSRRSPGCGRCCVRERHHVPAPRRGRSQRALPSRPAAPGRRVRRQADDAAPRRAGAGRLGVKGARWLAHDRVASALPPCPAGSGAAGRADQNANFEPSIVATMTAGTPSAMATSAKASASIMTTPCRAGTFFKKRPARDPGWPRSGDGGCDGHHKTGDLAGPGDGGPQPTAPSPLASERC